MKQDKALSVGLRDLRLETIIGIHPHERRAKQPLSISLGVEVEAGELSIDSVEQTVSYSDFPRIIREEAAKSPEMLEKLAHDILTKIFELDPRIMAGDIEIRKPKAVMDAACAFVRLRLRRPRPPKQKKQK